ncbi:uncharacterized protein LOC115074677 [Rhinatrema bivittatum]|uniref:uncharacterized protein LOC115074677 n=1 Tax=Rhinatrema bivittatum TaxID=194408 RepID=UPI0011282500|nr:uncharacterized protein LOC115074677 [Rhinatrema bivittatum]XP_029430208.1 uncharacterized protein LOC115074677 [Rhinatrema bivittatum]
MPGLEDPEPLLSPVDPIEEKKSLLEVLSVGTSASSMERERGEFSIPPKPATVTLDLLWDLMASIGQFVKEADGRYKKVEAEMQSLNLKAKDHFKDFGKRLSEVEKTTAQVQMVNVKMIKDLGSQSKRLESLENYTRHLNLRFLNFPRALGEDIQSTLKKFFLENLKFEESKLPIVNKAYFLTKMERRIKGNQLGVLENLTLFIESSAIEILGRGTLLVSFVIEKDISNVMRAYFQNSTENFYGQLVKIFPDFARPTQLRRQEFIKLRPQVVALGYTFVLRYPCRCLIKG